MSAKASQGVRWGICREQERHNRSRTAEEIYLQDIVASYGEFTGEDHGLITTSHDHMNTWKKCSQGHHDMIDRVRYHGGSKRVRLVDMYDSSHAKGEINHVIAMWLQKSKDGANGC